MCDDIIQKCCRICLDVESHHVSILGDTTISLHLKACLSVTVSSNDHLPQTICVSCVSSLNQFYNFKLNARCSQDWLESAAQAKMKKSSEIKMPLQPLPDSEYNSDSLLEFLNNTANIEEYLNNLGKEDIPCIVNMLDKNEHSMELAKTNIKCIKIPSPQKKESSKQFKMETDVYTDFKIVKELINKKDSELKETQMKVDKNSFVCYGCHKNHDSVVKLHQHMSVCDSAGRTCVHCNLLFDSKQQMQQHSLSHSTSLFLSCNCGERFPTKKQLMKHHKICNMDYGAVVGCMYRCKECGDTFKERLHLYRHAREHIIKAEQRICDICGHTFVGNDALTKHRKEEHENRENVIYRCKICNTILSDHKEMFIHVKNHTTKPEPTRHLCECCGRSFATQTTLLRHSRQHGTSGTKCSICHRVFTDTNTLNEHIVQHIEKVMCERCGQSVNCYKLDKHSCV